MSIHSISHVLMAPLALVFIYLGYQSFTQLNYPYSIWMILPLTCLVMLYLFKGQLDYWWLTKYPVKFDEGLARFLMANNSYYENLKGEEKTKFETRLNLYMEGREFKAVGHEQRDVPYDLKALLSSIPVQLTMHKDDFLIGDMDRIFLYKHPFPTPGKQYLHALETHTTDGVIILSLAQFSAAEKEPDKHYNVAWHAYIEAFLIIGKDDTSPIDDYATWENIEAIAGYDQASLLNYTGLKALDPLVVLCTLFFTNGDKMEGLNPEIYKSLSSFFQRDKLVKPNIVLQD